MNLQELNRNIERHKRLNRSYEMADALRLKAGLHAPRMDGMPHGTDVTDSVGAIAAALADLMTSIEALESELEQSDDEIRAFANSFEDERLQVAIQLRYIGCLSWGQTADALGPAYSSKGIRKLVCGAVDLRGAQGNSGELGDPRGYTGTLGGNEGN